jgi:hypothetical protein
VVANTLLWLQYRFGVEQQTLVGEHADAFRGRTLFARSGSAEELLSHLFEEELLVLDGIQRAHLFGRLIFLALG